MAHQVYLDNHATTPMDPHVVASMSPYYTEHFGNPGSIGHQFGEVARHAVEDARTSIAELLNVANNEIVFTSGATEANNLAIRGIADRHQTTKGHFLSVQTEHKAVLDPLSRLAKQGFDITLLNTVQSPDPMAGWLDPQKVKDGLRDDTRLVSVMLANNEIGTIQPLEEIVSICHERGVLLHCDATQAVGKVSVDIDLLDVDLLSFSGHKIYGPRGVGALVVRRRRPRIKLAPLIEGGGQEQGLRSGTLNVPGIVGLARALEICHDGMREEALRIGLLRDKLYADVLESLDGVGLNGPVFPHRLTGNLNLHFGDVDGEALMMNMDRVAVSSGSACTSANPEPSHVLRAIGLSEDATRSSLRFGIGRFNKDEDIDIAVSTLREAVVRLRGLRQS